MSMSNVLHAIVGTVEVDRLRSLLPPYASDLQLLGFGPTFAVAVEKSRALDDVTRVDRVASEIATSIPEVFVLHWDDRVGHRSATLYRGGIRVSELNESDETWFELDEDGKPMLSGRSFSATEAEELDPDEIEVGTIQDALDLVASKSEAVSPEMIRELRDRLSRN